MRYIRAPLVNFPRADRSGWIQNDARDILRDNDQYMTSSQTEQAPETNSDLQLVERTLMLARQAGYDHILLDTLDDMEAARALYLELGFTEVAPYYHNPLAGAHYLKADLK